MSTVYIVRTLHGEVTVDGPWAVVEYRNGFRNAATGCSTEVSARDRARSQKSARDATGFRATTYAYGVERAQRRDIP